MEQISFVDRGALALKIASTPHAKIGFALSAHLGMNSTTIFLRKQKNDNLLYELKKLERDQDCGSIIFYKNLAFCQSNHSTYYTENNTVNPRFPWRDYFYCAWFTIFEYFLNNNITDVHLDHLTSGCYWPETMQGVMLQAAKDAAYQCNSHLVISIDHGVSVSELEAMWDTVEEKDKNELEYFPRTSVELGKFTKVTFFDE